ncbi:MAG: type secretion system rane subunit TssM, partial [Pseudomonadota bacterium]
MKRLSAWLFRPVVLVVLGLLALSALIWWIGPLVAIASWSPLAPLWVRITLLLLLWGGWLLLRLLATLRRKRLNDRLLKDLASQTDQAVGQEAQLLERRFAEAMHKLKDAQRPGLWGGERYLYELPWFVFIGAPGSGKTTALQHAGLQFLLADGGQAGAPPVLRGVGGTRHCDWWFTREAVLIDTAGRYSTQDSHREVDASAWQRFLVLLKQSRPRQPISGILLTVSVPDLLQASREARREQATQLRARLQELQEKLAIRPPVYVLVTKADLLGGFNDSFEALGKEERDQVWGYSLSREVDVAGGDAALAACGQHFRELQQRLNAQLPARMEAERDPGRRASLFAFPQEFGALGEPLEDFLRQVCASGGALESAPRLRGVYFTSGTQEGSPIDRVIGALGRSFGLDPRRHSLPGGSGRSYFLGRLLRELVFAEAGLGVVDARLIRRQRLLRHAGLVGIALVAVLTVLGWAVSRARNIDLAAQIGEGLPPLAQAIAGLPPAQTSDVLPLIQVLGRAEAAARVAGIDPADPPWLHGLGIYQGEKLDAAAQQAYQRLLQKTLAPRLALRLEERLRDSRRDQPEQAYEQLKAYLMLHAPEHLEVKALRRSIRADWDQQYPRLPADVRQQMDHHLDALLASGRISPPGPRNEALVSSVREMLSAFPLEHRIAQRLRQQYVPGSVPDLSVAGAAGPQAGQVFVRQSGAPLSQGQSGYYTRAGYEQVFKPGLPPVALQLAREEAWVLGTPADAQRLKEAASGGPLWDRSKQVYLTAYIKAWDELLADVRIVPFDTLERSMGVSRLLGAVDSPLAAWLRAASRETQLTTPPPKGSAAAVGEKLAGAAAQALGSASPGEPVEAMVDQHFAALHRQFAGSPAPIEDTLKLFQDLATYFMAVDSARRSKTAPPPQAALEKARQAGPQLPEALGQVLLAAAEAGSRAGTEAERGGLNAELRPLTETCQRIVANRYPFASGARAETPLEDFGQLFAPAGLLDDFFQKRLQALVDSSVTPWAYRPSSSGSQPVS